jgi:hypothetical protein
MDLPPQPRGCQGGVEYFPNLPMLSGLPLAAGTDVRDRAHARRGRSGEVPVVTV